MDDMRNMLLSELIDKMHGRLADKMYPSDTKPMADAIAPEAEKADEQAMEMPEHGDDEMTDEELDTMMKETE